ncbi:MAG: hypothetical protein WC878_01560 [Candidatus Paceibacterota bacterium]|jgi:hypothetical protein
MNADTIVASLKEWFGPRKEIAKCEGDSPSARFNRLINFALDHVDENIFIIYRQWLDIFFETDWTEASSSEENMKLFVDKLNSLKS